MKLSEEIRDCVELMRNQDLRFRKSQDGRDRLDGEQALWMDSEFLRNTLPATLSVMKALGVALDPYSGDKMALVPAARSWCAAVRKACK